MIKTIKEEIKIKLILEAWRVCSSWQNGLFLSYKCTSFWKSTILSVIGNTDAESKFYIHVVLNINELRA